MKTKLQGKKEESPHVVLVIIALNALEQIENLNSRYRDKGPFRALTTQFKAAIATFVFISVSEFGKKQRLPLRFFRSTSGSDQSSVSVKCECLTDSLSVIVNFNSNFAVSSFHPSDCVDHASVSQCAVWDCNSFPGQSSEDGSRLSFHTFPLKNASRLKAWVHACGRQNLTPTKSDRVCSLHFDSGDFERDLQLELLGHDPKKRQRARKLKPESVPRLPEHHPGAIESKSSKTREHSIRRAKRAAHQEALREILEASQAQASSEAGVGNEEAGK
ncbi:hypothetical protein CAPTEDRAFT_198539, partial [Capitella teleta]